ncbi:OLC1v1016238C1 [Oldenlandia corymbosa var. corymbosa]|uniref:WAT1-related protein n=1 Tax=Oldenlandia corymbosa var. corymbosa TaxID=529605 RepID=A0AAV1E5I8_OLDCO|nr:OLC1v1016238C1 [Oldenlandia corymbosa var. corymbosa]
MLISSLSLAPIAYFLERKSRPKLKWTISFQLFLSAIVGASVTQYLFLLGIQYTSATFSCAFLNLVPVLTFLMALPFGMESVSIKSSGGKAKVIGSMVCIGGAIFLTLYKGMPLNMHHHYDHHSIIFDDSKSMSPREKKERWIKGCAALFGGTMMWSSWFILQSKISKRYPCNYTSTSIMAFFSSLQSALLCFCIYRDLSIWFLKPNLEMLTVIYAGMVGSGLCFVGMTWCVKKKGPVFTAAFSPFVQIIAAIFEVPLFHEQLYLGTLIGSSIVIVGLYMLLWAKNHEAQILEPKETPSKQFQIIHVNHEPNPA